MDAEGLAIMLRPAVTKPPVSPLCTKDDDEFHTTMIAMRPPTSPTTVIGGFSLAIITRKQITRPS